MNCVLRTAHCIIVQMIRFGGRLTTSRTCFQSSKPRFAAKSFTPMCNVGDQAITITHWDSKTCPYAQRAWVSLIEKNVPFKIRQVDLNNKDEEFKAVYSKIHPDPSAVAKIPIFQDHTTRVTLIESMVIADYLEHKYKSSGTQLLPDNPDHTANIKLFIEIFNSTFTPAMFSLFQADTKAKVEEGRGRLAAALRTIDHLLQERSQPDGPFFMGSKFSQAEVVTIPFIQRGVATLPEYRGIDVWQIVGEVKARRMKEWMEAGLARPSLIETKPTDEVIRDGMRKFLVQKMKEDN